VIECPAPSTTIFQARKLDHLHLVFPLVVMMLAFCTSTEVLLHPTDGNNRRNETGQRDAPERSAKDSVNSISGGHWDFVIECRITDAINDARL
jgi:hypothetical protein